MEEDIIPTPIQFDWDKGNSEKNWIKHKVTIKESEEIFFDRQVILIKSKKPIAKETRHIAFGTTNNDRKLTVVFTVRDDKVRIISARDQSKN